MHSQAALESVSVNNIASNTEMSESVTLEETTSTSNQDSQTESIPLAEADSKETNTTTEQNYKTHSHKLSFQFRSPVADSAVVIK